MGSRVVVTMGAKVTVHRLTLQAQRGLGSRLTHLLGNNDTSMAIKDIASLPWEVTIIIIPHLTRRPHPGGAVC